MADGELLNFVSVI